MKALPLALAGAVLTAFASAQAVNIAPLGIATQQSNYPSSFAWKAIDGFTNGFWFNGMRLSSTNGSLGGWWQLDFPHPYAVSELRIFNRADGWGERLSNFRVTVHLGATQVFGQNYYEGTGSVPLGGIEAILLPAGAIADRVRIELIDGHNNANNGFLTLAEVQVFSRPIGSIYCSPAQPNVSGGPATIEAVGSRVVSSPDATALVAHGLPENTFGYFLVGSTSAQVTPPGSNGVLCIGGTIGRYSSAIHNTGLTENMGLVIDRAHLPTSPGRAIIAGETWHFQAWFRDGASSNFSDGVAITFL